MVKPRDEFVGLLNTASQNAQFVAQVLASRGYHIRILPHSVAPSVEERWKHTDDGDLEITQRIELKHWPNIDFKSLDEIPYENVIVDEAYKIEKLHRTTLYAYLILNASVTGYVLIPVWTRPQWFKQERGDGREGALRMYYMCPKKNLTFHRLAEEQPSVTPILRPEDAAPEAGNGPTSAMEQASLFSYCHKHGTYSGDANCPGCEKERTA